MYKFIGWQRKQGEGDINGVFRKWDNIELHCITDCDPSVHGQSMYPIKIKQVDCERILGCPIHSVDKLIGKTFKPDFGLFNGKTVLTKLIFSDNSVVSMPNEYKPK